MLLGVAALWQVRGSAQAAAALATAYLDGEDSPVPDDLRWRVPELYDRFRGTRYFRELAGTLTEGAVSGRDKIDRMLEWTYLQVRPAALAAPARVVWDNPYRTLKRGFGFCDQSAHVFTILAREAGFDARIFFLRRPDGESPHTITQVLLDGQWVFVDTLFGRVVEVDGIPVTLESLRNDPALLDAAYEGVGPTLPFSVDNFLRGDPPYGDNAPWRRVPNAYAPASPPRGAQADGVLLYDEFREAALRSDWARAEAAYTELGAMSLPEDLKQALAYHAALAAYDAGNWETAAARGEAALAQAPASPWRLSLYALIGRSRERLGQLEAALNAYNVADLASTRILARNLTRNLETSSASLTPAAQ